jgi:hypothetical protein
LNSRDKIAEIIAEAERIAYQCGWNDACAAIRESVDHHQRHDTSTSNGTIAPQTRARRGRPPSKTFEIVRDYISANPGMRSEAIVKAAQLVDADLKEPTVRAYLRRLKQKKIIWHRADRWYAGREKSPMENELAVAS